MGAKVRRIFGVEKGVGVISESVKYVKGGAASPLAGALSGCFHACRNGRGPGGTGIGRGVLKALAECFVPVRSKSSLPDARISPCALSCPSESSLCAGPSPLLAARPSPSGREPVRRASFRCGSGSAVSGNLPVSSGFLWDTVFLVFSLPCAQFSSRMARVFFLPYHICWLGRSFLPSQAVIFTVSGGHFQ